MSGKDWVCTRMHKVTETLGQKVKEIAAAASPGKQVSQFLSSMDVATMGMIIMIATAPHEWGQPPVYGATESSQMRRKTLTNQTQVSITG